MAVHYEKHGSVAVLTIDSPPVNALGAAVRQGLADGLEAGGRDDHVRAFVLIGRGMFSAGADIREFGKSFQPPHLDDLISAIEENDKPVVAAIDGVALGGGLELALGCHYRLGTAQARYSQPEVKLGIVPGAGGTQRLPRVAGITAALRMIAIGDPVGGEEAREIGILDELVTDDLVERAIAFAAEISVRGAALPRTRARDDKLDEARANPRIFDEFRAEIAKKARGYTTPERCIECVMAAVELPFDAGLQREREIFVECLESDESKALIHMFGAVRRAADIPDVPRDTPTLPVAIAAVVGAGTMGGGIAMNFANAGIPVRLIDVSQAALDRSLETIRANYKRTASRGRLTDAEMSKRLSLIEGTLEFDATGDVDIVVEAVFEEMDLKKEMFARLDRVCDPGVILATNTSTLDVDEIAAATSRPEWVIGMHFFSPANVMRLLEVVRGEKTAKDVLATVMKLAKTIGKIGVAVGVCDGFVGNRMLAGYAREAEFLLEEGALPHQVDKVLFDFGFPMGRFAMGDLAGNDVSWRIRKQKTATRPPNQRYSPIADKICELGRFGQKTGAGWYRYEAGSRTPIPDPAVERIIIETSQELSIKRREISNQEIIQRCLYPLINEGAKILEEGIALKSSDIDVIYVNGYGFPPYRGGPMFYADATGLGSVRDAICGYHERHGDLWAPAPLLTQLAEENSRFIDWSTR